MKKWMKTLTALCLTVALLSTMLVGGVSAADTIAVDWYGFEQETVTVELGEGTYTQMPVMFPQNATETGLTWISDNSAVATVDAATGVVTLVSEGTANITATLSDTSALDDLGIAAGISYELIVAPTTGISGTLMVKPSNVVLTHPSNTELTVTGAVGAITVTPSNEAVATASELNGVINVSSAGAGYMDLTVTDGTNTVVIPVSVVPTDVVSAKESWMALYPNPASTTADPGYLQWYFETVPTATAGVLGYGVTPTFTVLDAETHYDSANNRILFNPLDPSKYSNFKYNGGGMTVTDYYHAFSVKVPMDGRVSVGSVGEAYFVHSGNSDGSFMGIFRTREVEGVATTNRVFPAEDPSTKESAYTQEVTTNWLWIYPDNMSVGQPANTGSGKVLTQPHVDMLAAFNKDGAIIDVKKDDIIRVIVHAGENNYSDSGIRLVPKIEYVVDDLIDVLNVDREIEIMKGRTTTISPRMNPYWMMPDITLTKEMDSSPEVSLDSYTYLDGNKLGMVDITLSATTGGVGYYRLDCGPVSKLIKISVATSDLDISYRDYVLGMIRWYATTNTDVLPLNYTVLVTSAETNADGSIKIDAVTKDEKVCTVTTAKNNTSGSQERWNIGSTFGGKKVDVFFFTDVANLELVSINAVKADLQL